MVVLPGNFNQVDPTGTPWLIGNQPTPGHAKCIKIRDCIDITGHRRQHRTDGMSDKK
jgi:hypothetical protein